MGINPSADVRKEKMITIRKSEERRHLEDKDQITWMTFDLGNESDPLQYGFSSLQILNEEIIFPESRVLLHANKDMVFVTYVREGVIIHVGPLEKPVLEGAKEFQVLNAAPGIAQYAFNVSRSEDAHIFECGFAANEGLLKLGARKKIFTHAERHGLLKLIASPDGREDSLPLQLDVQMYSTFIHQGNHIIHELKFGRSAWLHVVSGEIQADNHRLRKGDGVGFSDERSVSFTAKIPAEIILFDLCGQVPRETKKSLERELQTAESR